MPTKIVSKKPAPDGRMLRSRLTREKIVAAISLLIREGCLIPTAEQVAERAGIGRRTVFRHFDDMESLNRDINQLVMADVVAALNQPLVAPSWQERLFEDIAIRCALYDSIASFHIAAQITRHQSSSIGEVMDLYASLHLERLRRILPLDMVDHAPTFHGLALIISMDAWIRLRREQGLDAEAASAVIEHAASALITGASKAEPISPGA
ncbi:MAG: AcrR family transcriptional regulator [Janthinobacterium sp.]|jgi:AcrR family transcriptional regulator